MNGLWLALALGCGEAPVAEEPAPVEVHAWLEEVGERSGTLVVQTRYDPEGEVDLPQPAAEGLTFEHQGEPLVERIGSREVLTQRYRFTGPKGMYEIGALRATWHGASDPVEASSSPLFVDLQVAPPREEEPLDIVEPRPVQPIPWALVGAGAAGAAVLGLGLWVGFGATRRRELPPPPPEPPDVIALRAWAAIRADPDRDDHARAQGLSQVFRTYAEAVLGFPASSWTTTEILEHLRCLEHLPEGNVPRARRLLRATDRVKFADQDPDRDFFEELDADLRAFIESTRPRTWSAEEAR